MRDLSIILRTSLSNLYPRYIKPVVQIVSFQEPDIGTAIVEKAVASLNRLDVLISNIDTFRRTPGKSSESYDEYVEIMKQNCDVPVKAVLAAIQHLKKSKGNIVFVSSVASVKPSPDTYAYTMSKAALSQFAKCLAIDLAPDVRVNLVSSDQMLAAHCRALGLDSGGVNEYMRATNLVGESKCHDSVAAAILFLISDQASYINGHEMFIDGGYIIKPPDSNVAQVIRAKLKAKSN